MKCFFIVASMIVALAGSISQVQAQNYNDACCVPVQYDSCCMPPCTSNCCEQFQGFYVGGHVGYGFHDTVWVDRDAWIDNYSNDWALGSVCTTNSGAIYGLQFGYNYQCCCTLFGLEVDSTWSRLHRSKDFTPVPAAGTHLTLRHRMNWFGTIRGRAGIVCDNLLLFVTGGAALANNKHTWTIDDPNFATEDFRQHKVRWGLAVGSGVEWACSECFTIKAEALYLKFPEYTRTVFSDQAAQDIRFDLLDAIWIARVGVNFKFSGIFNSCGCCW